MLERLLIGAGFAQLSIALASLAIPHLLNWREGLRPLSPLMRAIFLVYAGYILSTNLFFGAISILLPRELTNGSALAAALTGFITLYWGARLLLQFFAFSRLDRPSGRIFVVGEMLLVTAFSAITAIFVFAFVSNLR